MKIFKNVVSQGISYIINKGSLYFLFILIAREWSPELFGNLSLALAISSLFIFGCDWGMNTLLIREIARNPEKSNVFLSQAFLISLISSTFTLCFLFGLGLIWKKSLWFPKILSFFYIYQSIEVFILVARSYFFAIERMEIDTIGRIIALIISFPLAILIIYKGLNVNFLLGTLIMGSIINLSFLILMYLKTGRKILCKDHFSNPWRLFKTSIPFGINVLFSSIYAQASLVILGLLQGVTEVAIFKATLNITVPFTLIIGAVSMALYPSFSRYYLWEKDALCRIIRKICFCLFPFLFCVCVLIFVFAENIIGMLYKQKFPEAVFLLHILSIAIFFNGVKTLLAVVLTSVNRQKERTTSVVIGSGISVFLNCFLGMRYSYTGASFAYLFTEIIICILILYHLRDILPAIFGKQPGRESDLKNSDMPFLCEEFIQK